MQSFEVQKDTIQFFYEIDKYWQDHIKEKQNKIIKKLKPLYKGITGHMISPSREAFLYRNLDRLLSYRLVKSAMSKEDFIEYILTKGEFFNGFYNVLCDYYFKRLNRDDIKAIHETYKDVKFDLLEDTYNKCVK